MKRILPVIFTLGTVVYGRCIGLPPGYEHGHQIQAVPPPVNSPPPIQTKG